MELSIPAAGAVGGPHPFHLHGHAFDVVRGAGETDYNYANPPRRDVVSIGAAGDNVTIRWFTDNPGPWFLHCHIDWHLELFVLSTIILVIKLIDAFHSGLALVFAEAPEDWASANAVTSTYTMHIIFRYQPDLYTL